LLTLKSAGTSAVTVNTNNHRYRFLHHRRRLPDFSQSRGDDDTYDPVLAKPGRSGVRTTYGQ
jgi:hypothetical protein